jgi:hypothetical protein
VYVLVALAIFSLLLCCGWWFSCCFCGLCCPVKLQRVLGVLAVIMCIITLLSIAIAMHRLQRLIDSGVVVVSNSMHAVKAVHQLARDSKDN